MKRPGSQFDDEFDYESFTLDRLLQLQEEADSEKLNLRSKVDALNDTIRDLYARNQVQEAALQGKRDNAVASIILSVMAAVFLGFGVNFLSDQNSNTDNLGLILLIFFFALEGISSWFRLR